MGVVGADGACNVCGRIDPEAARRIDARDARRADDESGADGTNGAEPAEEGAAAPAGATDAGSRGAAEASGGPAGDEWQERKLCVDGACIGVVSDGRCNTCGKAQ